MDEKKREALSREDRSGGRRLSGLLLLLALLCALTLAASSLGRFSRIRAEAPEPAEAEPPPALAAEESPAGSAGQEEIGNAPALFPAEGAEEQQPEALPEGEAAREREPRLHISRDSGAYPETQLTVCIDAPAGYRIAYTTDGRRPGPEDDCGSGNLKLHLLPGGTGYLMSRRDQLVSPLDSGGLLESPELPRGRVLRAALLDPEGRILAEETRIFFLGVDFARRYPGCLVLSVFTDPENLLDDETGILVPGAVFRRWIQSEEAKEFLRTGEWWNYESNATQRGRTWERPCLLQIYSGGSRPAVEMKAGIRVTGGASRRLVQKSFNFYFREEYGEKKLRYELFPGASLYDSFTLRAGGNNTEGLKFKDGFLQSLAQGLDLTVPACRPAVLFLNGEYWGPYLLREKVSAQMLHDRCGVDEEQVVVIKDGQIEVGEEEDLALFRELEAFAERDLADPEVYREFGGILDLRSFAEHCALRIYIGDTDWFPGANEILWRTRDESWQEGKWQFILHDLGCSAGLYHDPEEEARRDHFRETLENNPLFAAAMRNPDFRELFLLALKEMGEEVYEAERVEREIREWDREWQPLLPDYYRRYDVSPEYWTEGLESTVIFFRERYPAILSRVEKWMSEQEG